MENNESWDKKIEYLKATRDQMWNDDYFEFLMKSVWKIETPVNIVDYGCGYGYLGLRMLPLLPAGSTYTGIDMEEELLEEAKRLFECLTYDVTFIKKDLLEYIPQSQYDLAICQSFLRHIPCAKDMLRKMIDSVCGNGLIVCIEPNRRMENAGLFTDTQEFDLGGNDDLLKKKWSKEYEQGQRDYLVGSKLPIYMKQLGLVNIGVRCNDFVEVIMPEQDKYQEQKEIFIANNIPYAKDCITDDTSIVFARNHLISYGYKECGT